MAAYALLIGKKSGKRELLLEGDPVAIRQIFKTHGGEGFEEIEVLDSRSGRVKHRAFPKASAQAKKTKA